MSLNYYLNTNLKISTLFGSGNYNFRSLPINKISDYSFPINMGLGAIEYMNNTIGNFQTIYLMQRSYFSVDSIAGHSSLIEALCNDDNEFADGLKETSNDLFIEEL